MVDMRRFRPSIVKMMFFGLIFFISCGRDISRDLLSDIESYIDSRPDSALAAIRQIDTTALHGRAVKAKYSLLHAIALDKNYIDTADTRVVQPAVDYYDRHGSPEQRLNAYMYLGTEQYNAGRYNQAIVSFSHAAEFAEKVDDQNLRGILYSRMADTFTATKEYTPAASYIGKSLDCFRKCGRKDQERLVRKKEAINLVQRREWDKADSCFCSLLADKELGTGLRRKIEMSYGMFLLNYSGLRDSLAYVTITKALMEGEELSDASELAAFAYLSDMAGEKGVADSLWRIAETSDGFDPFEYHYWKHRDLRLHKDYQGSYSSLWKAVQARDSMNNRVSRHSATESQRAFVERNLINRAYKIKTQKLQVIISLLSCIILFMLLLVTGFVHQRKRQKMSDEQERMASAIESLKTQLKDMKNLAGRTKFVFLSEIYESAYRNISSETSGNSPFEEALRTKIGDLQTDKKAQINFEKMLDKEMNNVMTRFRKKCPGLTESEYKMASYYFAGFDNITVMVIMRISSRDNVRTKKKRLKEKIDSFGKDGEEFANLI